MIRENLSFI